MQQILFSLHTQSFVTQEHMCNFCTLIVVRYLKKIPQNNMATQNVVPYCYIVENPAIGQQSVATLALV